MCLKQTATAFEQYPFRSTIKRGTSTETCKREARRQILRFLVCGLHVVCLVTFPISTHIHTHTQRAVVSELHWLVLCELYKYLYFVFKNKRAVQRNESTFILLNHSGDRIKGLSIQLLRFPVKGGGGEGFKARRGGAKTIKDEVKTN